MDKLYTLPFSKKSPVPSKESLQLIMQFATAYNSIKIGNVTTDFNAN